MTQTRVDKLVDEYISFQSRSPSPFHVVQSLCGMLTEGGFKPLDPSSNDSMSPGERFFLEHPDGKSLICGITGKKNPADSGFHITGSHTDSPVLRLRLKPWSGDSNLIRLETQVHGGLIARTWLDRPLMVAGAVYKIKRKGQGKISFDSANGRPSVERKVVSSQHAVAVIPDIAIHLDPGKNSQGEINLETMLSAFVSSGDASMQESQDKFWSHLGVSAHEVDNM